MSDLNREEIEAVCWDATYCLIMLLIKFDLKSAHVVDRSIDYNIDAYIARMHCD